MLIDKREKLCYTILRVILCNFKEYEKGSRQHLRPLSQVHTVKYKPMKQFFLDIVGNRALVAAFFAWFSAQILKFFIAAAIDRKFSIERLCGDGGMPSGHSATVMALAVTVGIEAGWGSVMFAACVVLAVVVMHDAMGVRRETGKQAREILKIFEIFNNMVAEKDRQLKHEKLKILVGHTPFQVICGAILGVLVAVLCSVIV